MDAIAELLGITVSQLTILGVAGAALVVAWFVLKTVMKIASRVFAIGCLGLLVVVGALYAIFVLGV